MGKNNRIRSTMLFQITVMLLVVFIASSAISYVFYVRSTNKMINKSMDRFITNQAADMTTSFLFVTQLITEMTEEKVGKINIGDFITAIKTKQVLPVQEKASQKMKELVNSSTLGITVCAVALPKIPSMVSKPLIIMASDDKYLYSNIPETISKHFTGKGGYALLKNGIPEWGLRGEQLLVVSLQRAEKLQGFGVWAILVRPMAKDISAINSFYRDQKNDTNQVMITVMVCSIVVLVLLVFVVLGLMIKRKITRPMDELADAAEHVMEGDLDVKVLIREGEDFANLKVTFNKMVEAIQNIISRSTVD